MRLTYSLTELDHKITLGALVGLLGVLIGLALAVTILLCFDVATGWITVIVSLFCGLSCLHFQDWRKKWLLRLQAATTLAFALLVYGWCIAIAHFMPAQPLQGVTLWEYLADAAVATPIAGFWARIFFSILRHAP